MKKILTAVIVLLGTCYASAQTCKIKIYYDDNGNRILRALECAKPAPDESTSVKESANLAAGYQVYPNPAENKVNIKLDADLLAKGYGIVMTDIIGKILYEQRSITQTVSTIDLQGYADGTYFIVIAQGMERHTVKVVKQTGSGY